MSFKKGLLAARHHIIFMLGLAAAFGTVIYLEMLEVPKADFKVDLSDKIPEIKHRELTEQELEWADIAWTYFENNLHEETGLVNSVNDYPAATLWDTASYFLALISVERLGMIEREEFDFRMSKALESLAKFELHDGLLPNKSYNARTLAMVDYQNNPTERGIGWSAIDIGRVMVPFNVLVWKYPHHTEAVNKVIAAWDMDSVVVGGTMYGATVLEDGSTFLVQEGRIGYEEYAAKSMALGGFDLSAALLYNDFLKYEDIYGVDVPTDKRTPEKYTAHNYVVSESYILDAIEYGGDRISKEFTYRVYQAQVERYQTEGILTAVSEDNIDQAPYFVYNTVFSSGKAWNAITEDGEDASEFKTLSTKAGIGWHMLYETDYTELLVEALKDNYEEGKGWYSGIYEVSGKPNKAITANTNAIILESLHFKVFGPILSIGKPGGVAAQEEKDKEEAKEKAAETAEEEKTETAEEADKAEQATNALTAEQQDQQQTETTATESTTTEATTAEVSTTEAVIDAVAEQTEQASEVVESLEGEVVSEVEQVEQVVEDSAEETAQETKDKVESEVKEAAEKADVSDKAEAVKTEAADEVKVIDEVINVTDVKEVAKAQKVTKVKEETEVKAVTVIKDSTSTMDKEAAEAIKSGESAVEEIKADQPVTTEDDKKEPIADAKENGEEVSQLRKDTENTVNKSITSSKPVAETSLEGSTEAAAAVE